MPPVLRPRDGRFDPVPAPPLRIAGPRAFDDDAAGDTEIGDSTPGRPLQREEMRAGVLTAAAIDRMPAVYDRDAALLPADEVPRSPPPAASRPRSSSSRPA